MELVRIKASPKQLSKLRNGHKVKIAPAMSGEGFNLLIDPSKFNHITKSFNKGKGSMVQLSPEEIRVNAETEMEGAGIFSTLKKGAKAIAKSDIGKALGKQAIDAGVAIASKSGYVSPEIASAVGNVASKKLAGAGVLDVVKKVAKSKIAKDLGKQAINMAVKKASASGYVPPAIAEAVGAEAKKQLAGAGVLDTLKKGAKAVAKSKIAKDLGKQAINMAVKQASASGYVPPSIASAVGAEAQKQLAGYGLWSGGGGEGRGLYAGARSRGVMGRGALMSVHNAGLPPALQSQNLSANFHFSTQMPPSLQRIEMSGAGLGFP